MTVKTTFAQRFEFARDRQRARGTWQEDGELAQIIGVAASSITGYKAKGEAPPAERTVALALAVGVDPGWLAFGEASEAPTPEGFTDWLAHKYPPRPAKPVHDARPFAEAIPDQRASTKKKKKPAKRVSGSG